MGSGPFSCGDFISQVSAHIPWIREARQQSLQNKVVTQLTPTLCLLQNFQRSKMTTCHLSPCAFLSSAQPAFYAHEGKENNKQKHFKPTNWENWVTCTFFAFKLYKGWHGLPGSATLSLGGLASLKSWGVPEAPAQGAFVPSQGDWQRGQITQLYL